MNRWFEKKTVIILLFIVVIHCNMQGQTHKSNVIYRDTIINSSIERFFCDLKNYRKGLFKKDLFLDLSSFPCDYYIPDSIIDNIKNDVIWVPSIMQLVLEYKDNEREYPTIRFSWNVDDEGRIRIFFGFYIIGYDKKEMLISFAFSFTIAYYYKYNNLKKTWEYCGSNI